MSGKTTILGSGAMATACAILLAEQPGRQVAIWGRCPDRAAEFSRTRENRRLLPGVLVPPQVEITADIERAIAGADLLVASTPTKFLRATLSALAPALPPELPVVSVVKGIENDTFRRPSEIIEETLGRRPVAVLSGPSHAEEVARRMPASVVAASRDPELARQVQHVFTTDRFRVYTNPDLLGVELAGALKNVIGIAAGISDGLGYGDNAKSALMTRGVVEMTRFGAALGAQSATFAGLAGIGDLITTCISPHGRNRKVGERLGRGETLAQILASMDSVAEGVNTAQSVQGLAARRGIVMPIVEEVYQVLFAGKSAADATNSLMQRPLREE